MGIEFVDLSPHLAAELRDIVEESETTHQPVKVHFAGTRQIVSARAQPTADGFRFATALPFLRVDAEVDIALSPDAGITTKGRVSGVVLDRSQADGTPRLVIDVRVDTPTDTRSAADPTDRGQTSEAVLMWREASHQTEKSHARSHRSRRLWRGAGLLAGGIALVAFVVVVPSGWFMPLSPSASLRRLASSMITPQQPPPAAPALPVSAPVTAPTRPGPAAVAAPEPVSEPLPEPVAEPSEFTVGLTGSLAGAVRYRLRAPDGVAFNLPHARAATKVGTYRPAVPGLRAVWVRDLPGGGTHLRFFFGGSRPAPDVQLRPDGVRVVAAP